MKTFTGTIAEYLLENHQENLKDVALVFPGRRAGLFLTRELSERSMTSMFSPQIMTLDQLASEMTGISQGETIPMLYDLYESYISVTASSRSFDDFIFHGNTLLSDFNECDNELIDADKLFLNISDIKEIDELYSDNIFFAKDFILDFWQMFIGNSHLDLQTKFSELWKMMPGVYHQFTEKLAAKKTGYGGFIMRHAVNDENALTEYFEKHPWEHIYFAGFNALTRSEKALFEKFRKSGKASFLWDYDEYFVNSSTHEAGMFMRENLRRFPMPESFVKKASGLYNRYQLKKEILVIPVPQVTDEARILNRLWDQGELKGNTAVVLADEKLLVPVIHALPSDLKANVTMGYEVRNTATFALLDTILTLYKNSKLSKTGRYFKSTDTSKILGHFFFRKYQKEVQEIQKNVLQNRKYITAAETVSCDDMSLIFSFEGQPGNFVGFMEEVLRFIYSSVAALSEFPSQKPEMQAAYEISMQIRQLRLTIESHSVPIALLSTISVLIKKVISLLSLSFRGEPLTGLQIMGFLETRAIDFENVVILSANEGKLPKTSAGISFIPMTLRKGFRMRTPSYDEAIFAYNFYRLIQRAEKVHITYTTGQGITEKNEMSRYILQLMYDKTHALIIHPIDNRPEIHMPLTVAIEKDSQTQAKLDELKSGKRPFSASMLNAYIECSLRFYFRYMAGLRDVEDVPEEDMENRIIGNLFHKTVQLLYEAKFQKNQALTVASFDAISEKDKSEAIDKAFCAVLNYKNKNYHDSLSGTEWLYQEIITRYLTAFINFEKASCPFVYMGHEEELSTTFEDTEIVLKGYIDRMDEKAGLVQITDYKTSALKSVIIHPDKCLNVKAPGRGYVFQMFLYQYIVSKKLQRKSSVRLLPVNKLMTDNPQVIENLCDDLNQLSDFRTILNGIFDSIFNVELGFIQTENKKSCEYCAYKDICNR